jgi:serine/threonine protein kinase
LTEEDMSFLSASKQTTYLKQFDIEQEGTPFEQTFPWENAHVTDLLKKMLSFNPYFRISVEECLAHEYFADVEAEEDDKVLDADGFTVQFEECSETELRKLLEETFTYFEENRDANFGC